MFRIILTVLRSALALAMGIIVGTALIILGHFLSMLVFPPPPGLDLNDAKAVSEYMATVPESAFVLVLLSHAMGPLGGGFVAAWIAGRGKVFHALVIGEFFLAGGIMNLFDLPQHPHWFRILDPLMYLPVAYAAGLLAPRGKFQVKTDDVPYAPSGTK